MPARTVLSSDDIGRSITRISHEIIESNHGTSKLVLLGIPTRGVTLAERIGSVIAKNDSNFDQNLQVGQLDVTMYRDDLAANYSKVPVESVIPSYGIVGANIILIDDVLYSGRTVRAALDALNDFGRPNSVKLAVLVDRGHRELPIRADFVGKNLPTSRDERISVRLLETDGLDSVVIE